MIMLFSLSVVGSDLPHPNDKRRVHDLCIKLENVLWEENSALGHFIETTKIIDKALATTKLSPYEASRRKSFTLELVSLATTGTNAGLAPSGTRQQGTVQWFDTDRGFGIIQQANGCDVFVHYSDIWGTGYRTLKENQAVEFNVIRTDRRFQAKDVEILDTTEVPGP